MQSDATVLGNIRIGDEAVLTAKSMVLKSVPKGGRMAGVPAKVVGYGREESDVSLPSDWFFEEAWLGRNGLTKGEGRALYGEVERAFMRYEVKELR